MVECCSYAWNSESLLKVKVGWQVLKQLGSQQCHTGLTSYISDLKLSKSLHEKMGYIAYQSKFCPTRLCEETLGTQYISLDFKKW